jgi:hypothetical protein
MTDAVAPSTDPVAEDEPLVCPNCGYDLRAAVGGRCSECGSVFDQEELRTSSFPWAHRRHRGRIRAYLLTVWLVLINSRRIAHDASRTQLASDGRSFRRVTAVILAIELLLGFRLLHLAIDGYATFGARHQAYRTVNLPDPWLQDLVVPWSAGATLPPVLPLVLVAVAFHLTGVQRRLFRLRSQPPRLRERGRAIADYAAAPMLLNVPAVAWYTLVEHYLHIHQIPHTWFDRRGLPAWILLAVAFLLSALRITQWSMRVRNAGAERVLIDVPYLFALWSLGLIVWLLLVPWLVGFFWIVIDSLR